jgi:predicted methyltransferase
MKLLAVAVMVAVSAQPVPAADRISAALSAWDRPAGDLAADAGHKPAEILGRLQLAPGQQVLDVVAGGGSYTRLIAPVVAPGVVYARTTAGLMDPDAFLKQLHAAMVPGGLVLVVDHRAKAGAEPQAETAARHWIDPDVAKAATTKAGFVLQAESDLLALPSDGLSKMVYDPDIRGKTDRFVQVWRKP